jgi:hypothetical protein
MCKEICRHPGTEKKIFEMLRKELQAREMVKTILSGGKIEELDNITVDPKMPRPLHHKRYMAWPQNFQRGIIQLNGQTLQNQPFGFRLSLE